MRRIALIALAATVLWICSGRTLAATITIQLIVNGRTAETDSPPFVMNHRLLVPLRSLAEGLGYRVEYNDGDQSVILYAAGKTEPYATLQLYSDRVTAGEAVIIAPFPVIVRSGRSFVPVEFAANLLGFKAMWDADRSGLSVSSETDKNPATAVRTDAALVAAAESFCGVNSNREAEFAQLAHAEIWVDSQAPALTISQELMLLRAPAQLSPGHLSQACAVAFRPAKYHSPPNSGAPDQTGWLVTYNGLEMHGRGSWAAVNREAQFLLAQDLSPVMELTYR